MVIISMGMYAKTLTNAQMAVINVIATRERATIMSVPTHVLATMPAGDLMKLTATLVTISTNVPSQPTTVSTQTVLILMAALSVLVTLVTMEHQAALASMNVLVVTTTNVKLGKAETVFVPMLPLVTPALVHLVTAMIGTRMNGMPNRVTFKSVLTSMSVQLTIITAMKMPPAVILMAVMNVNVILDTLPMAAMPILVDAVMSTNVLNLRKLMVYYIQFIDVIPMPLAVILMAVMNVHVILVSMTSTVTDAHAKMLTNVLLPLTTLITWHALMEINVSTLTVLRGVNVFLVSKMSTEMVKRANKSMNAKPNPMHVILMPNAQIPLDHGPVSVIKVIIC